MIVLLDLNGTLASNSHDTGLTHDGQCDPADVARELYRQDIVDIVKSHTVALITARRPRFKVVTLAQIARLTGWQPQLVFFNSTTLRVHEYKPVIVQTELFPVYGTNRADYVGIDSNPRTRASYRAIGIRSYRYAEPQWREALADGGIPDA